MGITAVGDQLTRWGVFRAGTKYVLVIAGGGPGLEFTLDATEKR